MLKIADPLVSLVRITPKHNSLILKEKKTLLLYRGTSLTFFKQNPISRSILRTNHKIPNNFLSRFLHFLNLIKIVHFDPLNTYLDLDFWCPTRLLVIIDFRHPQSLSRIKCKLIHNMEIENGVSQSGWVTKNGGPRHWHLIPFGQRCPTLSPPQHSYPFRSSNLNTINIYAIFQQINNYTMFHPR